MHRLLIRGALACLLSVFAVVGVAAQDLPPSGKTPDFEAAKSSLAVRLYPEAPYRSSVETGVWKRDFEGVLSVLVYDFPTHVEMVPSAHVAGWGMTDEELFELGINNVVKRFPPIVESLDDYGIHFLISDDEVYVTTLVYRLELFPQVVGRYGSLISMPDRHTVVILPLDGPPAAESASAFLNITVGLYMDADHPVSYHVWFYDKVGFSRADIIVDGSIYLLLPDFVLQD